MHSFPRSRRRACQSRGRAHGDCIRFLNDSLGNECIYLLPKARCLHRPPAFHSCVIFPDRFHFAMNSSLWRIRLFVIYFALLSFRAAARIAQQSSLWRIRLFAIYFALLSFRAAARIAQQSSLWRIRQIEKDSCTRSCASTDGCSCLFLLGSERKQKNTPLRVRGVTCNGVFLRSSGKEGEGKKTGRSLRVYLGGINYLRKGNFLMGLFYVCSLRQL